MFLENKLNISGILYSKRNYYNLNTDYWVWYKNNEYKLLSANSNYDTGEIYSLIIRRDSENSIFSEFSEKIEF